MNGGGLGRDAEKTPERECRNGHLVVKGRQRARSFSDSNFARLSARGELLVYDPGKCEWKGVWWAGQQIAHH